MNAKVGHEGMVRRAGGTEEGDHGVAAAVAAAQQGDGEAIRYLYVSFAESVYSFVRSILRDAHEAEDVTQHVFAKLPARIKKYEPRAVPFKAWLLRVARNAALDSLRAHRTVPVEEVRPVGEPMEDRGLGEALRTALASLPEDQREVLFLRHVIGLSPSEIAERLHKTEGAIHGLHHRGRRAIKAELTLLGAAPSTA